VHATWPKILGVCKDMYGRHNQHVQSVRLAYDDYNNIWLPKMMGVFNWELTPTYKPDSGEGTGVFAEAGAELIPGAFPEV
jgi:hypothetical protein